MSTTRGLVSRICTKLLKINLKKYKQRCNNDRETTNSHFTGEETYTPNRFIKASGTTPLTTGVGEDAG
jgi:hypothetical protein